MADSVVLGGEDEEGEFDERAKQVRGKGTGWAVCKHEGT
jgi:hypothetical protein